MNSEDSTFFVYILKCEDSRGKITFYTGSTDNLQKRINMHACGRGAKYTKGKRVELVHFERFRTRSEAMKREYEIKDIPLEKKKVLFANGSSKSSK